MEDESKKIADNQLPVKRVSGTPSKKSKLSTVSTEAQDFLKKLEKRKTGPGDIANTLESWLEDEQ